ncbi:pyridoxal 5'-phosphate synthase glutaminase subunit PdxT [Heliobacterium chlorum]|uniref:pyridoxal 5'-phosphate synthase glutaminase subunit PdxT n=1 Tax=Heliobacterium chlorum TaxID=2698 RepID=UPI001A9B4509
MDKLKIGVLAMQGAFVEHEQMLQSLGCDTVQVRKVEHLADLDGLIIPGGESTTIGKLLVDFGLAESVQKRAQQGMPVWGTCAGLILMAKEIAGSEQYRLGLMDITAVRNAFGRQVDSFEVPLAIDEVSSEPYPAVFIRAPFIEKAGPSVKILAEHNGKVVMARQGSFLASAFHPELTQDGRVHAYFMDVVRESRQKV